MSLDLKTANERNYAFTFRRTTLKYNTVETYLRQIKYFESLGCKVDNKVFEKTAGLHMHGIIRVPINLSLMRFRVRGWSIKLEELYDLDGWIKYINKDQVIDDEYIDPPDDPDFIMPNKKLFRPIPECRETEV